MAFNIFTMNMFIDCKVPAPYRDHSLVAGRVFYILPNELLTELIKSCGPAAFDAGVLGLEQALTDEIQANSRFVGYNEKGDAFTHTLLPWKDIPLPNPSDEMMKKMGWSRDSYNKFLEEAPKRISPYRDALRGYLGWLLTNRQYLDERDAIFTRWAAEIRTWGIPQNGPTFFGDAKHSTLIERVTHPRTNDWLVEFARFYARWRLQHLVTRELPEPLAPQVPILTPLALLTHMQAGGVSFYQPDTLPVATPDQLRTMLDDIRNRTQNDHLLEWICEISDTGSTSHSIRKFSQILNLHFYWRLLEDRHPGLLEGRKGKVTEAFGEYLGVVPRAVQAARQTIMSRLQQA